MPNPREPITITLGSRCWTMRPMTLGQLRLAVPEFEYLAQPRPSDVVLERSLKIIAVALSPDNRDPEKLQAAMDELWQCESTLIEVSSAVNAIAELSGLAAKGEAQAGS